MELNMPTLNTRTDVLRNLVSKPITKAEEPTVVRELASVVIALSSDVFEVMRILKGNNGDGGGLISKVDDVAGKVDDVGKDVKTLAGMVNEVESQADEAEDEAKDAKTNSPFTKFITWFADRVLPSLVTGVIVYIVILLVQHYEH